MQRANLVIVAVIVILAAQFSFAEKPQNTCDRAGQVTLSGKRMAVRSALRDLAAQSGRNVAVATTVRGYVSVDLECVEFHVALREVLAQVGATYCETEEVIRIARRGQSSCENPQPVVEEVRRNEVKLGNPSKVARQATESALNVRSPSHY